MCYSMVIFLISMVPATWSVEVYFTAMKKKLSIIISLCVLAVVLLLCCTKMVDNSEIGIKFRKFSLTDQGELYASQVSLRI